MEGAKLEFDRKPKLFMMIQDSLIMIKRSSTHIVRNTDQLLGTFFQPVMFLLLFSAIYADSIKGLPNGVTYLQFLMAGIIIQMTAFGSTTTALAVANDMQKGIIDRFRSLPMSNIAVLSGHVISDLFRNFISTIVLILTGLVIGFRSGATPMEWLAIAGIIALFTLTFSWLSAIMGVFAKSIEAVQWMSFVIVFPLTFASSAFVPTAGMNSVVRAFAENQPITHVVEAARALMLNQPLGNHLWLAIVWCVGTLIIAIPLAAYLFKRKTS